MENMRCQKSAMDKMSHQNLRLTVENKLEQKKMKVLLSIMEEGVMKE